MQVLPFVQVKELPPSTSFYAAVAQPLGLRYISATSSSIIFGDTSSPTPEPVFEVKQNAVTDSLTVQPCRLILSAESPSIVSAFHAAALRSNPDLKDASTDVNYLHIHDHSDPGGESRAIIGDFDGNIMEVVHAGRPEYTSSHAGSAARRAHSSSREVSRILDWNLDVVTTSAPSRSGGGSVAASSTAVGTRVTESEPYTLLRKGVATSTVETPSQEMPKGLSTAAVVGTFLGAAVGAAVGGALTYSMLKAERERLAFQEHDMPPFTRRATYPEQSSDNRSRYYPPDSYAGRYSQVGGPRSRVVEEIDDRSSRHSSHYTTRSRSRGRSEASSTRRPLMVADIENRSSAGSKYSDAPRLLKDAEHHSAAGSRYPSDPHSHAGSRYTTASSRHSHDSDWCTYVSSKHTASRPLEADADTYVSAKTDKSASTIRGSPPLPKSKAAGRYSSSTAKAPGPNRTPSNTSARRVPPPESRVGSGSSGWEDDDDSVAPSDSISNIGSRHSRRSQYV